MMPHGVLTPDAPALAQSVRVGPERPGRRRRPSNRAHMRRRRGSAAEGGSRQCPCSSRLEAVADEGAANSFRVARMSSCVGRPASLPRCWIL